MDCSTLIRAFFSKFRGVGWYFSFFHILFIKQILSKQWRLFRHCCVGSGSVLFAYYMSHKMEARLIRVKTSTCNFGTYSLKPPLNAHADITIGARGLYSK